ncbi:TPA: hypothetical protein ACH3X2_005385 [Trebouxia sp. C0005]
MSDNIIAFLLDFLDQGELRPCCPCPDDETTTFLSHRQSSRLLQQCFRLLSPLSTVCVAAPRTATVFGAQSVETAQNCGRLCRVSTPRLACVRS